MTNDKKNALHTYRDETEPRPAQLDRLKARIRTTMADEQAVKSLLKELPAPKAGATDRVKSRLRGSHQASRAPMGRWIGFGVAATMAAAAAVLLFVNPSPTPTSNPGARPAPSFAQQPAPKPAPIEESPLEQVPTPITPEPKTATAMQLAQVTAFGQVKQKAAEGALAKLQPELEACYNQTEGAERLQVSVAVAANGTVQRLKVKGPGAEAFEDCARAPLQRMKLDSVQGTVAGTEDAPIGGGVIKFEIRKGK